MVNSIFKGNNCFDFHKHCQAVRGSLTPTLGARGAEAVCLEAEHSVLMKKKKSEGWNCLLKYFVNVMHYNIMYHDKWETI